MKRSFLTVLIISLALTVNAQIIKSEIPDKLVVFTFDDATASHFSIVAPLLKKYGFGATFFICEFPPNFADTAKYMNWRQISELHKMGFEIANHTKSHPMLTRLSPSEIEYELDYIDKKCDSMSISKPVTFAYPGYGLDSALVDYLQKRGFVFARAGGDRAYDPRTDHPLLIPSWAMVANNREQIMDAFDEAKEGKIVVLTIHGVPDIEHPWVNTPPELFSEYLEYLKENNFKVISLRELASFINTEEALTTIKPDIKQHTQRY
jgi:peptidoglycan/xylan/chitin deacetylase (PgdA/CDA1 family)